MLLVNEKLILIAVCFFLYGFPLSEEVYYYTNSRLALNIRCKDGKTAHYIEVKPSRILELEGNGNEYFMNPALHPY